MPKSARFPVLHVSPREGMIGLLPRMWSHPLCQLASVTIRSVFFMRYIRVNKGSAESLLLIPILYAPLPTITMFATLLLALLPLVAAKSKSKSIYIDFSSYDMSNPNNTVQAILANNSLIVNNYTVDSSSDPFSRTYTAANVALDSGYLTLKVSGGTQNGSSIPSAAIQTNDTNILYGTFKTTAISSTVPGVCHGYVAYALYIRKLNPY